MVNAYTINKASLCMVMKSNGPYLLVSKFRIAVILCTFYFEKISLNLVGLVSKYAHIGLG